MPPATFRQLQTFVLVAETGSFAGAASQLGVSSAAISGQVSALEHKLGRQLFARRPGTTPVLNDHGVALLEQARGLLDQAQGLAGAAKAPAPRARVGAGDYIIERVFLPGMARFQLSHPDIQIELVRINPDLVVEAMARLRLDLAYVSTVSDSLPAGAELIGAVRLGLFAAPDHAVTAAWPQAPLPMIMPLSGSGLERSIRSALLAAGRADYQVVTQAQHTRTMMELAEQGAGVCCVFRGDAEDSVRAGRLVELQAPLPAYRRWALRRPGPQLGRLEPLHRFFLELLRSNAES
jgi:DNA-binding transcriptional LysR family regulator